MKPSLYMVAIHMQSLYLPALPEAETEVELLELLDELPDDPFLLPELLVMVLPVPAEAVWPLFELFVAL